MVLRDSHLTSDWPPHLSPQRPCGAPLSSARRPGSSSRSLHPRPASAAAFYAGAQSQQVGDSHRHVGPRRAPTRAPRLGATVSRSRPFGGQTHQSNRSGVGRTPGPAPPTGKRRARSVAEGGLGRDPSVQFSLTFTSRSISTRCLRSRTLPRDTVTQTSRHRPLPGFAPALTDSDRPGRNPGPESAGPSSAARTGLCGKEDPVPAAVQSDRLSAGDSEHQL